MGDKPVALVGFREWIFSQDSGRWLSRRGAVEAQPSVLAGVAPPCVPPCARLAGPAVMGC